MRAKKKGTFPIDGQLLMILPRAGSTLRNQDVNLPELRLDTDGYYIEIKIDADPENPEEVEITRRIPLDNCTEEELQNLQIQFTNLELESCVEKGVKKTLESIEDRKLQRLLITLMTFLNPRQVAIVFYLYKELERQQSESSVYFRSNELLEWLGYKRQKDGSFPALIRSQINQDLVALHRMELVYAHSLKNGNNLGAKIIVKNILRIQDYEIDNVPRNFNLSKAADYTFELADSYTVLLGFLSGLKGKGGYVLFPDSIKILQENGSQPQRDYKTKLLNYITSRMEWESLTDGQYLVISKRYIFKNLDLLGSNASRNNQIFWDAVEELKKDGYILNAQELVVKKRQPSIQFQINPEMLSRA
jgi:hypothetical protein